MVKDFDSFLELCKDKGIDTGVIEKFIVPPEVENPKLFHARLYTAVNETSQLVPGMKEAANLLRNGMDKRYFQNMFVRDDRTMTENNTVHAGAVDIHINAPVWERNVAAEGLDLRECGVLSKLRSAMHTAERMVKDDGVTEDYDHMLEIHAELCKNITESIKRQLPDFEDVNVVIRPYAKEIQKGKVFVTPSEEETLVGVQYDNQLAGCIIDGHHPGVRVDYDKALVEGWFNARERAAKELMTTGDLAALSGNVRKMKEQENALSKHFSDLMEKQGFRVKSVLKEDALSHAVSRALEEKMAQIPPLEVSESKGNVLEK